ncbi:MAG: ATP synthase F1 subunit epsilon [Clostridiaceae bacterium]|nr:ATP synthase F1 subunit epsilon [Clostridiaceae bacterium]NBH77311.1 ATP synthase F1 subunit epsilon [Clostridiaceae bacterium]NBI80607.1 ATP synthase F1 subunit epsilon [Clostridiaceae bacterium]RKJ76513.1 ATP synthase F1 subunit epsilon [Butyricicoccus sp. 1XD8-22]
MATFHLKVLTAERSFFEGDVERLIVRTTEGDVGILPRHINYVAALGIGGMTITQDGSNRLAAVSGGFVEVSPEGTTVLARTCEWADEIDVTRARAAEERAKHLLESKENAKQQEVAEIRLKKAVNRIRVAEK